MKKISFTPNEYEVLSVMWKEGRPLTRPEIIEKSTDKTWKVNSIHILLNSLMSKGAVVIDGYAKYGRNYGRTYSVAITQEEYLATQLVSIVPEACDETVNIPGVVSALVENHKLDKKMIQELEAIIAQKKRELTE